MTSVAEGLAAATARLGQAGVESARLDARALLAEVLGVDGMALFSRPERRLSEAEERAFAAAVERRARREPLSHILGRREFWSLSLRVTADTLDPRPDTETLVETALDLVSDRRAPLRLLDLGTGTGCILLALLRELPNAFGVAVDRSLRACAVAADNARHLGLSERAAVVCGDWGRALDGCFDAIVSNPPYIMDQEIPLLQPEVARFEPRSALTGGTDGLECYRQIVPLLPDLLAPGGIAAFEVGRGQAGAVTALMAEAGLVPGGVRTDLAGIERCVWARRMAGSA